jgi:hypothetical protein
MYFQKMSVCWYWNQSEIGFVLYYILIAMKLMMYIGSDLIESIPLDQANIPKRGYVGSIKRSLKEKYRELIERIADKPEFLVIDLPQQMKYFR